jgi:hypothetical protein
MALLEGPARSCELVMKTGWVVKKRGQSGEISENGLKTKAFSDLAGLADLADLAGFNGIV